MKKNTLLLTLFLASFFANAQQYQWYEKLSASSGSNLYVNDIEIDNDYIYIVGSFTGTVDFDFTSNVDNRTAVDEDAFIAKYVMETRQLVWVTTTNSAGNQVAKKVVPTSTVYTPRLNVIIMNNSNSFSVKSVDFFTGNIFATSQTYTSTGSISINDFVKGDGIDLFIAGSFTGSLNTESITVNSSGGTDAFCMLIGNSSDTSYNVGWTRAYGGSGNDTANGIAYYSGNNRLFITGGFEQTADFNKYTNPNVLTLTSNGDKDIFVVDVSVSTGLPFNSSNLIQFGSNELDEGTSIAISNSSLYLNGIFKGTIDFNPDSGVNNVFSNGTTSSIFNAKYNLTPQLSYAWCHFEGGGSTLEYVGDFKVSEAQLLVYYVHNSLGPGTIGSYVLARNINTGVTPNTFFGSFYYSASNSLMRSLELNPNGNILISGDFSGTIDVDYNNSNQVPVTSNPGISGIIIKNSLCNLSASVSGVNVSPNPVCSGNLVTVSLDSNSKLNDNAEYKWYDASSFVPVLLGTGSSINLNPTVTKNYFVRGEGGCVGNGSNRNFTITVNPLPDATLTVTGNTITSNEAGGAYQWLDCNNGNAQIFGATSQSFTPSSSGSYACLVANMFDCQITTNCVNITVLSTDDFSKLGIKLYPNPVKNSFKIEGDVVIETLSIYDILGQKIKSFTNINTFDIEDLASGIYIVEIISNKGTASTKIIKE